MERVVYRTVWFDGMRHEYRLEVRERPGALTVLSARLVRRWAMDPRAR